MARGDDVRDRVLSAVQELVLEGDASPTFDAISARAGVSKGGVLHHFRDRRALAVGLVERALDIIGEAMTAAAARGDAARTWLQLSASRGPDHEAARAMLSLVRVEAGGRIALPDRTGAAVAAWQAMIAAELGDPVRAAIVRLVGDGLFAAALAGTLPAEAEFDAIVDRLLEPSTGASR